MNRRELDSFVAHHRLSHRAAGVTLDAAQARPSSTEVAHFLVRMLQLAGVLSLAAGLVFFLAANWEEFRVFGHFALVQGLLATSACVALWKPPPHVMGRSALLLAFTITGALLALFGQTYQTGADLYELFLTWAVLGLAFVIAGQWSVTWAAWVLVLNVAFFLFCVWQPQQGWFWIILSGATLSQAQLLLAPTFLDVLLWILIASLDGPRWTGLGPRWLNRLVLTCATAFGTWAGTAAILRFDNDAMTRGDALVLCMLTALAAGLITQALRRRRDVFPLALIGASVIFQSTCAFAKYSDLDESLLFFTLALWLIAASTIAGRALMRLVRSWHHEANAA